MNRSQRHHSGIAAMICRAGLFGVVALLLVGVTVQSARADAIIPVDGWTSDTVAYGSIANVIDAVVDYDSFLGMGQTGLGTFTGPYTVTFDLGGTYNLTGMNLWNNAGYIPFDGEGVDGFTLTFRDSSSSVLGTFSGNAADSLSLQVFPFDAQGVSLVDFTITSNQDPTGRRYAAFHEINFVPEPATLSLLGFGLGVLALRRRPR